MRLDAETRRLALKYVVWFGDVWSPLVQVVTQRHGAVPMLDAATEYGVAEAGGKRLADTRELARGGCVSKPLRKPSSFLVELCSTTGKRWRR